MADKSCVFCAVVAGGDRDTIYRDDKVAAFLDHSPVIHGHTLVVTAKHYDIANNRVDDPALGFGRDCTGHRRAGNA